MTRMRNYFDMSDTDTRIHISFKFSYFIEVWEGPKHTKTFIFEEPPLFNVCNLVTTFLLCIRFITVSVSDDRMNDKQS